MASAPKGGKDAPDDMVYLAGALLVGLALWLIWSQARPAVVWANYGLDWAKYAALDALGLLDERGRKLYVWVTATFDGRVDPYEVEWADLVAVREDAGRRVRWLMTGLIAALGVTAAFKMKGDGFRRRFSLSGRERKSVFRVGGHRVDNKIAVWLLRHLLPLLGMKKLVSEKKEWVQKDVNFMQFQADHWKAVLPGTKLDPEAAVFDFEGFIKEYDFNAGKPKAEGRYGSFDFVRDYPPEAPQLSPMEWMLVNSVRLTKREGLDEDAAERAFQRQLGAGWQGVEKAQTHVQAICVLAALNIKRDGKKAEKLRDRLNEIYSLSPKDKAEGEVKAALAPYLGDKAVVAAIDRHGSKHAFTNPAVIGIYGWGGPMKEWGGGDAGVLSTSMFRWLKKLDRPLWYALNNVGRRRFHIEGAASVAHFFSERVVGGPLAEAHIDCAIGGPGQGGLADYIEQQGLEELEPFFRITKDF